MFHDFLGFSQTYILLGTNISALLKIIFPRVAYVSSLAGTHPFFGEARSVPPKKLDRSRCSLDHPPLRFSPALDIRKIRSYRSGDIQKMKVCKIWNPEMNPKMKIRNPKMKMSILSPKNGRLVQIIFVLNQVIFRSHVNLWGSVGTKDSWEIFGIPILDI